MAATSGFIYGNFRNYVDRQIQVRNNVLSKPERSPEDLLYITGKTAWVKMTSAVDFNESSNLAKQYNLYGSDIAKQYQLFGGTLWRNKTPDGKEFDALRYGIGATKNKGISSSTNYGLGGYTEAGFRPMPGIESVTVKSKNQFGSLKEATVTFKCWNMEQLNILESLYMRPGYQVLLEWGHTIYYNNDSSPKLINGNKIQYIDFFNKGLKTPQDVLEQIEIYKLNSGGNYDGILGIVKNFTFSANTDGSYSCMTNLITWGEIVESLKINAAPLSSLSVFGTPDPTNTSTSNNTNVSQSINTSKTQLEEYLRALRLAIDSTQSTDDKLIDNAETYVNDIDSSSSNYYQLSPEKEIGNFNSSPEEIDSITGLQSPSVYTIRFKNAETNKVEKSVYIPLARLLLAMNSINGIYGKNGNNILPINYDIQHNKALTSPLQFSTDPNVCYYLSSYDTLINPEGGTAAVFKKDYESVLPIRDAENPQVMNFMALPINIDYIIKTLNGSQNKDTSEVNLLSFLQELMRGINTALGNYNNFDVTVDNNTIFIIDKQYLPLNYSINPSKIRVSGTKNSKTGGTDFGFVYSYNFSSRITNKIGAEIAISAQANASALGMDNVAFSKLNKGMKDRINPYINDSTQKYYAPDPTKQDESPEVKIARGFNVLKEFYGKITKADPSFTLEDISANQPFLRDILNKIKSKADEGTTFIPIDLNLSIEGIAGMRLGECFLIETEKLPANYKYVDGSPKVKFLVRTLDHSISNNVWTTNLSALSVINPQNIKNASSFNDDIKSIISDDLLEQEAAEEARRKEQEQWRNDHKEEIQQYDENRKKREEKLALIDAEIQAVTNQINAAQDRDTTPLQNQLDALKRSRAELASPDVTVKLSDGSTSTLVGMKDNPVYQAMQQANQSR